MKALLLIAHGSRREESNLEVVELAERLAAIAGNEYSSVRACFLELAKPSIPDAVETCVRENTHQIVAIPYFLSAGRHVVEDVPRELANASQGNPQLSISICAHIGAIDAMPGLLLEATRELLISPS